MHYLHSTYLLKKAAKTSFIVIFAFIQSVAAVAHAANGCAEIFQRAMEKLHTSCADLGRNQACYGNQSVTATLRDSSLSFDDVGERVDVAYVERLTASALNMETGDWGLSLLKLKVNLPDTLPGANVTFLVHGGTSVENVSGDMQVFYFTSSLGEPQCSQLPPSSIVVQSPNHQRVTFVANGVQINMGSTVVLSAQPNATMKIHLLEGSANVTAYGHTVSLTPNQVSTIPLSGIDGLTAIGTPSAPVMQAPDTTTDNLFNAVTDLTDDNPEGNDGAIVPAIPGVPENTGDNGSASSEQGATGKGAKEEKAAEKAEKKEDKAAEKAEKKEDKKGKK